MTKNYTTSFVQANLPFNIWALEGYELYNKTNEPKTKQVSAQLNTCHTEKAEY